MTAWGTLAQNVRLKKRKDGRVPNVGLGGQDFAPVVGISVLHVKGETDDPANVDVHH